MENLLNLIEQVRAILIQEDDKLQKHEIYSQFINECKSNNLSEYDFYKKILKEAHKSIDWVSIEEDKKRKAEGKKKSEDFAKSEAKKIQDAPEFIESLIRFSFADGVVEATELHTIFSKAGELLQDENAIAKRFKALFDKNKYTPYPNPKLNSTSLKETLLSTNWYNPQQYTKITTPPSPPPAFPWKMIFTVFIIAGLIGFLIHKYNIQSKEAEIKFKEAEFKLREAEIKLSIENAKQDSISSLRLNKLGVQKKINNDAVFLKEQNAIKQKQLRDKELRKQKALEVATAYKKEKDLILQREAKAQYRKDIEDKNEKNRQLNLSMKCNFCNGTGIEIESTCKKCSGTGKKMFGKCKECSGFGKIININKTLCRKCEGTGKKIE